MCLFWKSAAHVGQADLPDTRVFEHSRSETVHGYDRTAEIRRCLVEAATDTVAGNRSLLWPDTGWVIGGIRVFERCTNRHTVLDRLDPEGAVSHGAEDLGYRLEDGVVAHLPVRVLDLSAEKRVLSRMGDEHRHEQQNGDEHRDECFQTTFHGNSS